MTTADNIDYCLQIHLPVKLGFPLFVLYFNDFHRYKNDASYQITLLHIEVKVIPGLN
jgi:hypothetical protein